MARHVEITHTYQVKIPADAQEAIAELTKVAVGIMEGVINEMRGIENLHSDWKLMPRTYEPPKVRELVGLEKEGADIMFHQEPALHPWDQGVRFFPKDHPLYDAETQALREEGLIEDEKKELEGGS